MQKAMSLLVVEGNTAAVNAANIEAGGEANGVQYAKTLAAIAPDAARTIVYPCEAGADCLPADRALEDFDGVVWTGSALNLYERSAEIEHQLELARRVWDKGVPAFGSCWGLQVFASVLGGTIRRNPRGRELGVARSIFLTEAGREHPMFAGKPPAFDALAVHMDEIETPPPGAVMLASNAMSQWQAMVVEQAGKSFWGVQYHPEIDLFVCAIILRRYGQKLVDAGLFSSLASLEQTVQDWLVLHADPARADLAFRYGMSVHVLDRSAHERELVNWIAYRVRPRARQRSRA